MIDGYDKPIMNFYHNLDVAKENHKILKEFYSVLKACDSFLEFVFITGVSKYSHASFFDELNNLEDLTMDERYGTILGYTLEEILHSFSDRIEAFLEKEGISREQFLANINVWYKGYSWDGQHEVFNPFSILSFFKRFSFENYWYEIGGADFFLRLLWEKNINVGTLEAYKGYKVLFEGFDLEKMGVYSLLFQNGYLTVKWIDKSDDYPVYYLGYPNKEVRDLFLFHMLSLYTKRSLGVTKEHCKQIRGYLRDFDSKGFFKSVKDMLTHCTGFFENRMYFPSVFYILLKLLGAEIQSNDFLYNEKGCVEGILCFQDRVFVIVLGMDNREGDGGINKKYYERFLVEEREVRFLRVNYWDKKMLYDEKLLKHSSRNLANICKNKRG